MKNWRKQTKLEIQSLHQQLIQAQKDRDSTWVEHLRNQISMLRAMLEENS
jgi:hypothetical protein